MPKRHGNLFEKCFTPELLYQSYLRARRGKRETLSVQLFERDLGHNLSTLRDQLLEGSYEISPYRTFIIHEPKERVISAPAFRDRITQHAIYSMVYPIFDQTFIHDSYGCRIGKGTHAASDRLQDFMRKSHPDSYCLQLDVRKFYHSIDRTILRSLLEKKIKDARLLELMIDFSLTCSERGLPIGNLLSQLYGLIFLNPLDHFVKRELKVGNYVRYVDDSVLLNLSRDECHLLRNQISEFLLTTLNLELSRTNVTPLHRGIDFVGYRTWRNKRLIRKRSLRNFHRAVKKQDHDTIKSLLTHSKNTSSHRHLRNTLQ